MRAATTVSIIVPAYNEERLLADSLHSIRTAMGALEERGWSCELIVCDNNSRDRTAAIAAAAGAAVVFEPLNQIGRARNTGAAQARGEWLIFVDADSHPTRELFADVAGAILSGRCIGGGSTVAFSENIPSLHHAAWVWNTCSRLCRWAAGSFIFCEASAFRRLGGFNLQLYAGEEIDFSRRLKRLARERGHRVTILHRHPLLTSGRKARLYTPREMLAFLVRTILRGGRTLRSPEDCYTWYDGRR